MKSKLSHQLPKPVDAELQRVASMLKHARLAKGLTQTELAARLQISPTTVKAAERGDARVRIGILLSLFWVLGVMPLSESVPRAAAVPAGRVTAARRARRKVLDDF